ncbi:MAG: M23 family metallopeptidase, partial [Chloroflexota bacterium]
KIGQELIIPPTSGVLHEVKAGDTLDAIAKKYKGDTATIIALEANALTPPYTLTAGQRVMVPGGDKPYQPKVVYGYSGAVPSNVTRGSGSFVWPIGGVLTQQFWTGHRAIDVGARIGSAVTASDSGFVILVANDDYGYGKHIMINHGNGFETLYAHLSVILVSPGQTVRKGQVIALSGNTGRSTGPHLHFEVRYLGVQRNPFNYLP